MTVYRLEELTMPGLDALDRERAVVVLSVSPLEQHGPHLPLGVDAFTARYFAEEIAQRLVAERPGWSAVLAPTLHLGSFTFDAVGTVPVRQRVVRDAVVDFGEAFARAGFRHVLVANGHAGPTHLAALDEAATMVSRRHGIRMASLSGWLMWQFRSGRFLDRVEARLGRPLSDTERRAFAADAHAGWWETSMMLMLRPDLVDGAWRDLPPVTYSLPERLVPNYPLHDGRAGYVGHPSLADPAFAKATTEVLLAEVMALVHALLDGRLGAGGKRSPYYALPFFRTNFWPLTAVAGIGLAALAWLRPRR
ncbi:MAG TPA: creatininase family protein [Methylomirabilota bacterium]|nr:creatininase family protein [Methylomirabilota bacterium]